MHIRSVSARMFLAAAIFGAAVASGPAIPRAHAAPLNDAGKCREVQNCDRACLQGVADLYYKSLAAHDSSLLPLAPDAKYSETGSVVKIGDGLWRTVSGAPSCIAWKSTILNQGGIGPVDAVAAGRQRADHRRHAAARKSGKPQSHGNRNRDGSQGRESRISGARAADCNLPRISRPRFPRPSATRAMN